MKKCLRSGLTLLLRISNLRALKKCNLFFSNALIQLEWVENKLTCFFTKLICFKLLIIGILLGNALTLPAESLWKSFYPYLTIEKSLITKNITSKDSHGFDVNFKQMNTAALGLTFQKWNLAASVSLAAPWRQTADDCTAIHPGVDLNLAFQKKNIYVYGGYFLLLKKENKWTMEKDQITSPLYAGIGLKQRIHKFVLDFGLQASWGEYADYWSIGNKRKIASYALVTKIGYDFQKAFHPFLSFAMEKLNFTDKLGLRLALGITIGKKAAVNRAWPIIVEHIHFPVKKPNIYLYPEKKEQVKVIVKPNGKITVSDPPYNEGWQVTAHPDGSIDGTCGFLFYEAIVTIDTPRQGWCIAAHNTASFFKKTLTDYGFREREIADFLEYWVPKLSKSPFYLVHPVLDQDLKKICPLEVTPTPDQILRLWFVFKPSAKAVVLEEPKIPPFRRSGFVVTEWGGIMG